jgi:hypothetical protein
MGAHLNNYMAEFRPKGPVLLEPHETDAILTAEPLADDAKDREMSRKALYSAFLMAWHLVEDNGGLTALRRFLAGVADGGNPDRVCYEVYGEDLDDLAIRLNPLDTGEPLGEAVYPTKPHRPLH